MERLRHSILPGVVVDRRQIMELLLREALIARGVLQAEPPSAPKAERNRSRKDSETYRTAPVLV
jgi:hypothetical protein